MEMVTRKIQMQVCMPDFLIWLKAKSPGAVGSIYTLFELSDPLVIVDGELWSDESVFWQNRLVNGGYYTVVFCKSVFSFGLLTFS
jgi:hypothetical protein